MSATHLDQVLSGHRKPGRRLEALLAVALTEHGLAFVRGDFDLLDATLLEVE